MEIVWISLLCLVVSTSIIIYYKSVSLLYNGPEVFLASFMLISVFSLLLFNESFIDIRKGNNILIPVLSGFFLFYFYRLYQTIAIAPNPGYPTAIISIHILLVAIISALLFGSHINKYTIIGIIITIIGIYLLIKNLSKI